MTEQTKTKNTGVISIIKAVLLGTASFFILVFISAFVFSHFMIKTSYIPTVSYIIMYLCAFLTGVKSASSYKTKGYLRGIISGIAYIGILFIVFAILKKPITAKTYITSLIAILMSSSGGVVGISKNQ